ncbi:NAD(P)H-binding protein, partial [Streptomyces sp. NPDC127079]|uniref:NAD(P)H-binding protein n=1 Tax=Streptomyces sp. NPDC127079 TaxID=3347132 RepID=UPI003654F1FA
MAVITVFGATRYAGGHITDEALSRGHEVIAVNRSGSAEARRGLTPLAGSIEDEALVRDLAAKSDVLAVAVHGSVDGKPFLLPLVPSLLKAAAENGARLGVVGGAGSLHLTEDGPRLIDVGGGGRPGPQPGTGRHAGSPGRARGPPPPPPRALDHP